MSHVDAVVENGRLTENDIFDTYLVRLFGIFPSLKPHEVHDTCAIAEMGYHTLFARSHLKRFETENLAHDLNEGHVACQFVDGINLRTVNIFVGVVVKQVTISEDPEFFTQNLLATWSYAWQILYVLI